MFIRTERLGMVVCGERAPTDASANETCKACLERDHNDLVLDRAMAAAAGGMG